jgi:hypothetical protein
MTAQHFLFIERTEVIEYWIRPVEQIVLSEIGQSDRIIGFTAPDPHSGVSQLSHVVAEVFALSGFNTLLVDLATPIQDSPAQLVQEPPLALWLPGTGDSKTHIVHHERGFDFVTARVAKGTRFAFNNISQIRQVLSGELAEYTKVIMNLPPINEHCSELINPAAAAASCDSVLLVCVRGRVTRPQLKNAVGLLRAARCRLVGTVLLEGDYVTAGVEISRTLRRVFRSAPRIVAWLERRALSIKALN